MSQHCLARAPAGLATLAWAASTGRVEGALHADEGLLQVLARPEADSGVAVWSIDRLGPPGDPDGPTELERILSTATFGEHLLARARALRAAIVGIGPSAALARAADPVGDADPVLGFEALLHGRRVACSGRPFYAGWGLTQDSVQRPRVLSLDELVAGALIIYPTYISRASSGFTTAERAWLELRDPRAGRAATDSLLVRAMRLARTLRDRWRRRRAR